MKKILEHLYKQKAYVEALEILQRLEKSLAETRNDAQSASARLAQGVHLDEIDAVGKALRVIDGQAPAGQNMDVIQAKYLGALEKERILLHGISQHRETMVSLRGSLSIDVCKSLRGEHAEAVRSICSALKSLDSALEAESEIRSFVEKAGYHCNLKSFVSFEIGRIGDPNSAAGRYYPETLNYVTDFDDDISGNIDKPTTVRLLLAMPGVGVSGDILLMDGRIARQHIRVGQAEETSEKPRRVEKHGDGFTEAVLE